MTDWKTSDIPTQEGRVAIVTGGGRGLGFAVARELARAGAEVVLAVRSPERAQSALKAIQAAAGSDRVEAELLNLASLDSVHAFAERWHERRGAIDLIVNNAG